MDKERKTFGLKLISELDDVSERINCAFFCGSDDGNYCVYRLISTKTGLELVSQVFQIDTGSMIYFDSNHAI